MSSPASFRTLIFLTLFAASAGNPALATAATGLPVVYQDQHIIVRAGIPDSGSRPVHLGDTVSLQVEIEFAEGDIQVETPDDEWLQRSLAGIAGIRVYDSVTLASESTEQGRVRVASHWLLQPLDCPESKLSCPGPRAYALPIMTVSYQLSSSAETGLDTRSARFRPWPGEIAVVTALPGIPEPGTRLTDLLPSAAYPLPLAAGTPATVGGWLLAGGVAVLALSVLGSRQQPRTARVARRTKEPDTRWRRARAALDASGHSAEEGIELLRRATTWYCLDELACNPFVWLGPGGTGNLPKEPTAASWRSLFLDVLQAEAPGGGELNALCARFDELSGLAESAAAPASAA